MGIFSKGRIEPVRDKDRRVIPGSISEKLHITIGGLRQGMFIRGRDLANPVLLFIHGGPGFPEYFLFEKYPSGLEDFFTVCYWEQRGSGLSYNRKIAPENISLEHMLSDTLEVTEYLQHRFGKEKIFLMAHSGGTVFAIQAAARAPHLYMAYIGIAQVTRQAESEKLAYSYMMDQYETAGQWKRQDELRKYPVLESADAIISFFKSHVRDKSMHELGIGTMHNMRSVIRDIFLAVWSCKAYTFAEKWNFWISRSRLFPMTGIVEELIAADIPAQVPSLEIPVYLISGRYDMTVNAALSRRYFEALKAPVKGFYTFDFSAHSPMFEEPKKFRKIMSEEVLQLSISNADK